MSEAVVRFASVAEADPAVLQPDELARRDRLANPADRAAYVAAHVLVRECAAELLGVDAWALELGHRCPSCDAADHGAPYIRGHDIHVSLSHSREWVAAIASASRCGIDVEAVRADPPLPSALSPREHEWTLRQPDPAAAFTRLWVRKEALIKAGHGTLATAATIDTLDHDGQLTPKVGSLRLTDWNNANHAGAWAMS